MEFFRIINKKVSEFEIQKNIVPKTIEKYVESMFYLNGKENIFQGATLWGEFSITYHKINGGVRFTLLDCPNALAWTITTGFPPQTNCVILHCTINRTHQSEEFIEEIEAFLTEWEKGLLAKF